MRLRQYNAGSWLGAIRTQVASAQFYMGVVQLFLIAVAAIRTIQEWLPWLTFPMLLGALVVFYGVVMVFDYVFILGPVLSFTAHQTYKHDNPIVDDIKQIKADVKAIKEAIKYSPRVWG